MEKICILLAQKCLKSPKIWTGSVFKWFILIYNILKFFLKNCLIFAQKNLAFFHFFLIRTGGSQVMTDNTRQGMTAGRHIPL